MDGIAAALASFVRTLIAGGSPYDRFRFGEEPDALSTSAREGLELFRGPARCISCHTPPFFTDEDFHNTGVAWTGTDLADMGRYVVTERPEDLGAFKTPSLREVARTAPYMHDGSIETLEEVVEFYDEGGRANPHLDHLLRPLGLTDDEKASLVAFLRSLSGEYPGLNR